MSAEQDRRTLPASARRLRQAHRDGQCPDARDLGTVAAMTGGLLLLYLYRDVAFVPCLEYVRHGLRSAVALAQASSATPMTQTSALSFADWTSWMRAWLLASLPSVAGALFACVMVQAVRLRGAISIAAMLPRFERLNPAANAKALCSRDTWVELLKSLFKTMVLFLALGSAVRATLPALVHVPRLSPSGIVQALDSVLVQTLLPVLAAFALIAAWDTAYQSRRWRRQLRMTPEEARRERRDDEGDPQLRAHAREALKSAAADSQQPDRDGEVIGSR